MSPFPRLQALTAFLPTRKPGGPNLERDGCEQPGPPAEILDLYVEGLAEPIRCTPNHPFWSEDRDEFLAAGKLATGERLLLAEGDTAAVRRAQIAESSEPVFNVEVAGEHVYYVSSRGVLVHNAYSSKAKYSVYLGAKDSVIDYVGISKNFPARKAVHEAAGREVEDVIQGAGYRQARALEHELIQDLRKRGYTLANIQRGIAESSMGKYKEEHWKWARKKLKEILNDLDDS